MRIKRKWGFVSIEAVIVTAIILAAGLFGVLGLSGTGGQLVRNGIDKLEDLGIFPGGGNNGGGNDFTYDENGYPSDLDVKPGDITPVDEFQFQLNNEEDGYILVRYNGSSSNLVIPKEYEGLPVKEIGSFALASWSLSQPLRSIALPNSIEKIGSSSMQGSSLSTLILPDSIDVLDNSAFWNSTLTHVTFMGNVPSVLDSYIFDSNPGLGPRTILVRDNQVDAFKAIARSNLGVYPSAIYGPSTKAPTPQPVDENGYPLELNVDPSSIIPEDDFWFTWNDGLNGWEITGYKGSSKNLVIPNKRTSDGKPIVRISENSFTGPDYLDLVSIAIPNSIKVIGYWAFAHNQLTSVVIPDSVYFIGDFAFHDNKITSVKIPADTTVDWGAFNKNLLPDSKAFIYVNGTDAETLVSYGGQSKHPVIPAGTKHVDWFAFQQVGIESVVIPESVVEIRGRAFEYNDLTSINLPKDLKVLGQDAFADNKLASVSIPAGITAVARGAFRNNQIQSLGLHNKVTTIGELAFMGNSLTSLYIPNSVTEIGSHAFDSNGLIESQAYIYRNPHDRVDLVSYGGSSMHIIIPEGTKTIQERLFFGKGLHSVVFPEGIERIGRSAFENNDLTELVIPSSMINIAQEAFANNKLNTVRFNGPLPRNDWFNPFYRVFRDNYPLLAGSISVPSAHLNAYRDSAVWAGVTRGHFVGH